MITKTIKKNKEHINSPTLNTILIVENILKNMNESFITQANLKKILPKQINHNILKTILEYLEKSNKIAFTFKGIVWIYNPSKKLQNAINKGLEL